MADNPPAIFFLSVSSWSVKEAGPHFFIFFAAMQDIKAVIFDLGNVLIDWNPAYLFDKMFSDGDKKKYFLDHICTMDWNEKHDAGHPIQEGTAALVAEYPEWQEYIEAYYGRWEEMLGGILPGTVQILKNLKESGRYKLYALTNWSAELFPIALERYPFLQWFDGRVVSGEEKLRKPDERFYRILLDRFDLQPGEVVFIDDNLRNIEAAEKLGIRSHRFVSPEELKNWLVEQQIL